MYMMHDPFYWPLLLIGLALTFLPQMWVKSTIGRFNEVRTARGASGREVARAILAENGLSGVSVELTQGFLSDHYDPGQKVVRLSPDVYHGDSVSSVAVAAHECGHAIQHAKGFFPVVIRSAMVPAVNLGSSLGPLLLLAALILGSMRFLAPSLAFSIGVAGLLLYGAATAFHFVTLPVELDASGRALKVLETRNYLSAAEMPGAKKVLTAAAMTYVASALYALIELAHWAYLLFGRSRDD